MIGDASGGLLRRWRQNPPSDDHKVAVYVTGFQGHATMFSNYFKRLNQDYPNYFFDDMDNRAKISDRARIKPGERRRVIDNKEQLGKNLRWEECK